MFVRPRARLIALVVALSSFAGPTLLASAPASASSNNIQNQVNAILDELDQHLILCETFHARREEATAAAALLAERMQEKAALALRLGSLSEQRDSAAHAALREYFVAPPLAQRTASGHVDDAAADAVVLRHS
jgi:hypothetical protein